MRFKFTLELRGVAAAALVAAMAWRCDGLRADDIYSVGAAGASAARPPDMQERHLPVEAAAVRRLARARRIARTQRLSPKLMQS